MSSVFLMPARYDTGVVWLSFLIAVFSSCVALDLARRVRGPDRISSLVWLVGDAIVFGSGIWSMPFVGMLVFVLPIRLGYAAGAMVLSWLAAVAVSGLALADFGTGQSSLAMLRSLRVHELKIDRLLVRDVAQDAKSLELVGLVVRLAHVLGMRVVAEGVESRAQHDALVALGCDELLGCYFARPMAPQALVDVGLGRARGQDALAFSRAVLAPLPAAA